MPYSGITLYRYVYNILNTPNKSQNLQNFSFAHKGNTVNTKGRERSNFVYCRGRGRLLIIEHKIILFDNLSMSSMY